MLKFIKNYEITRKNLREKFIKFYAYNFRILFYRIFIRFKYTLLIKFHLINLFHNGLFISADIETYGYCNRSCEFCFNNPKFPQREKGIMSASLWKKIINELSEIHYYGRISPHFFGEPLLDKKLSEYVRYAREKCPNSYILIVSNGDLLDKDKLLELIDSGVNKLYITNYDDQLRPIIQHLVETYPAYIAVRQYTDFYKIDRAGMIFERKSSIQKPCLSLFGQLVINWKGEVVLCCMDYYAEYVFGNVKDGKIIDIWRGEKISNYRKKLIKGLRDSIEICEFCDYNGNIPW
ncbi:MAG: SPASM domain-containing protein [Candidatus Cloacimonetes bacterium]|nr:SPASM domain-containing protein [Candidatus Cloacimonadota bacterium]